MGLLENISLIRAARMLSPEEYEDLVMLLEVISYVQQHGEQSVEMFIPYLLECVCGPNSTLVTRSLCYRIVQKELKQRNYSKSCVPFRFSGSLIAFEEFDMRVFYQVLLKDAVDLKNPQAAYLAWNFLKEMPEDVIFGLFRMPSLESIYANYIADFIVSSRVCEVPMAKLDYITSSNEEDVESLKKTSNKKFISEKKEASKSMNEIGKDAEIAKSAVNEASDVGKLSTSAIIASIDFVLNSFFIYFPLLYNEDLLDVQDMLTQLMKLVVSLGFDVPTSKLSQDNPNNPVFTVRAASIAACDGLIYQYLSVGENGGLRCLPGGLLSPSFLFNRAYSRPFWRLIPRIFQNVICHLQILEEHFFSETDSGVSPPLLHEDKSVGEGIKHRFESFPYVCLFLPSIWDFGFFSCRRFDDILQASNCLTRVEELVNVEIWTFRCTIVCVLMYKPEALSNERQVNLLRDVSTRTARLLNCLITQLNEIISSASSDQKGFSSKQEDSLNWSCVLLAFYRAASCLATLKILLSQPRNLSERSAFPEKRESSSNRSQTTLKIMETSTLSLSDQSASVYVLITRIVSIMLEQQENPRLNQFFRQEITKKSNFSPSNSNFVRDFSPLKSKEDQTAAKLVNVRSDNITRGSRAILSFKSRKDKESSEAVSITMKAGKGASSSPISKSLEEQSLQPFCSPLPWEPPNFFFFSHLPGELTKISTMEYATSCVCSLLPFLYLSADGSTSCLTDSISGTGSPVAQSSLTKEAIALASTSVNDGASSKYHEFAEKTCLFLGISSNSKESFSSETRASLQPSVDKSEKKKLPQMVWPVEKPRKKGSFPVKNDVRLKIAELCRIVLYILAKEAAREAGSSSSLMNLRASRLAEILQVFSSSMQGGSHSYLPPSITSSSNNITGMNDRVAIRLLPPLCSDDLLMGLAELQRTLLIGYIAFAYSRTSRIHGVYCSEALIRRFPHLNAGKALLNVFPYFAPSNKNHLKPNYPPDLHTLISRSVATKQGKNLRASLATASRLHLDPSHSDQKILSPNPLAAFLDFEFIFLFGTEGAITTGSYRPSSSGAAIASEAAAFGGTSLLSSKKLSLGGWKSRSTTLKNRIPKKQHQLEASASSDLQNGFASDTEKMPGCNPFTAFSKGKKISSKIFNVLNSSASNVQRSDSKPVQPNSSPLKLDYRRILQAWTDLDNLLSHPRSIHGSSIRENFTNSPLKQSHEMHTPSYDGPTIDEGDGSFPAFKHDASSPVNVVSSLLINLFSKYHPERDVLDILSDECYLAFFENDSYRSTLRESSLFSSSDRVPLFFTGVRHLNPVFLSSINLLIQVATFVSLQEVVMQKGVTTSVFAEKEISLWDLLPSPFSSSPTLAFLSCVASRGCDVLLESSEQSFSSSSPSQNHLRSSSSSIQPASQPLSYKENGATQDLMTIELDEAFASTGQNDDYQFLSNIFSCIFYFFCCQAIVLQHEMTISQLDHAISTSSTLHSNPEDREETHIPRALQNHRSVSNPAIVSQGSGSSYLSIPHADDMKKTVFLGEASSSLQAANFDEATILHAVALGEYWLGSSLSLLQKGLSSVFPEASLKLWNTNDITAGVTCVVAGINLLACFFEGLLLKLLELHHSCGRHINFPSVLTRGWYSSEPFLRFLECLNAILTRLLGAVRDPSTVAVCVSSPTSHASNQATGIVDPAEDILCVLIVKSLCNSLLPMISTIKLSLNSGFFFEGIHQNFEEILKESWGLLLSFTSFSDSLYSANLESSAQITSIKSLKPKFSGVPKQKMFASSPLDGDAITANSASFSLDLASESFIDASSESIFGYIASSSNFEYLNAFKNIESFSDLASKTRKKDLSSLCVADPYTIIASSSPSWRATRVLNLIHYISSQNDVETEQLSKMPPQVLNAGPVLLTVTQSARVSSGSNTIISFEVNLLNSAGAKMNQICLELQLELKEGIRRGASKVHEPFTHCETAERNEHHYQESSSGWLEDLYDPSLLSSVFRFVGHSQYFIRSLDEKDSAVCLFEVEICEWAVVDVYFSLDFETENSGYSQSEELDLDTGLHDFETEQHEEISGVTTALTVRKMNDHSISDFLALMTGLEENNFQERAAAKRNYDSTLCCHIPFTLFMRPYYGFGTWLNLRSIPAELLSCGEVTKCSLLEKLELWATADMKYSDYTWVDAVSAAVWSPSSMLMIAACSTMRIFVAEAYGLGDIVTIILSFNEPCEVNYGADTLVAEDPVIAKLKANAINSLCRADIVSSNAYLPRYFAKYIEHWMS